MDRAGAETYLRLLAEAAMRGSLAPAAPGAPNASTILVVGHALTTVGALDPVTAEEILTDFRLAVSVRQLHSEPGQGPGQAVTVAQWLAQGRAVLRPKPRPAQPPGAGSAGEGSPGEGTPGEGTPGEDAGRDRADRFVPVGLTVPFRAGAISGELCLMSFAQTGTGARFIAAWQVHAPSLEVQLSHHYPGLIPFDEFTVTDDRGARYRLDHTPGSDLAWPNMIRLTPAPPGNIRWLDVAPPYRQAVRVDLAGGYGGAGSPPVRGVTGGRPPGATPPRSASATPISARASTCWSCWPSGCSPGRQSSRAAGCWPLRPPGRGRSWRAGSAISSGRSRRPTCCRRSARCQPGSPRCAPAWT